VTGLKPDQKIDLENPAIRAVITAAIIRQEGSKAYRSGIKDSTGGAVQIAKPEQQKSIDPVKKGVSIWNDQNHPLAAGSVDAGEMMGKPIAAAGEMMSDTVTMAIDLIQKATKQRVTDADIAQIKAYAKEVNDPEKVANAYLNLGGAPAKNTEQYMQRTSSKNLNQYFRE
jgi:L-cysteine desulfidase